VNLIKHGVDFALVSEFRFSDAFIVPDLRSDYGEMREVAVGFLRDRLHVLTFTRRGPVIRVISLRKANSREKRKYEQARKA
jgi:uncharacterized DUF497 family protein